MKTNIVDKKITGIVLVPRPGRQERIKKIIDQRVPKTQVVEKPLTINTRPMEFSINPHNRRDNDPHFGEVDTTREQFAREVRREKFIQ